MTVASFIPRAVCGRCRRPVRVCVCAHLPTLAPKARVVILQHPKEERMAIGTAQMAARCLEGSTVVVGTRVDSHRKVALALADLARQPVLLWPGPDAQDLATSPPEGPITLFVVDGTWSTAKKMITENPKIAALPRYAIAPATPSEYRIRREPRAECLSTIEAIAAALGVLEGDPEPYRAMLVPFRAMVDAQIDHQQRLHHPRDRSRLARRVRTVWAPPPRLADPSRVVVVAAEANAWPFDQKERYPDEVVHWLAVRGDGTERFERLAHPQEPLAPAVELHTELTAAAIASAPSRAELFEAFRAFLREGDVIATWGSFATRMLQAEGLALPGPIVDLRRTASEWLRDSPGSIEDFVRDHADPANPPPVLGAGRGGRRLGQMLYVLQAIQKSRNE